MLAELYRSSGLLDLEGDWRAVDWSGALARMLREDFGDVSPELRSRNLKALGNRSGFVLCRYEDWSGRGEFEMLACIDGASMSVSFDVLS